MTNKRFVLVVAAVAIVAAIALGVFFQPSRSGQHPLTAGINMPLSGDFAFPSKSFQEAVNLAIDDLKARDAEVRFGFAWNDNQSRPATAATLAQPQYAAAADLFYVGYGAELEAAMPVLQESQKPVFAFAFQASVTKHPLVFRNIVSYKNEASVFVEHARRRGAKKIAAIFHDLPDAHEQFSQLVLPGLLAAGIAKESVEFFPYPVGNPDFRTLAAKVKTTSPDLIMVSGFQANLVPLVEALQTAQMVRDGNVIGTFSILDLLTLTDGQTIEGVAAAMPTFMLRPSPMAVDFQNRFSAKFGRPASFNEFCGYDFVLILNSLVERLPQNPTPAQVVEAVQKTDIEGVSGRLRFDDEGDIIYPTEVAIFRNGKLVSLDGQ